MTIAELIPLAINLSMGLIVLGLALHASWDDATYLLRHPGLLVRSILSMNIIMPVLAAILVAIFRLHPAIVIAVVALALSPVPPILPGKQSKAGGTSSYVISLLATMAVLSIIIVPVGVALVGWAFGHDERAPMRVVIPAVLMSILVPLAVGLVVHQLAPAFAERVARWVALAGTVLLVVAFLPVLVQIWPLLMSMVGNGTLLVLALFAVVGLAVGHWLGGPVDDDRAVLALATATRHPGVALAIAAATFPEQKAVIAVVLWHLVVGAVVSGPYVSWRKRAHAQAHPNAPASP